MIRLTGFLIPLIILMIPIPGVFAQNFESPLAIYGGGGVINYKASNNQPVLNYSNFDPALQVGLQKYLGSAFDFRAQVLIAPNASFPSSAESVRQGALFDMQYAVNFKLNNGIVFREASFFAPYLTLGIGGSYFSDHPDAYVPFGGGVRFRLSQKMAVQVETQKKISLNKDYQHLAHAIAFVYNLNTPNIQNELEPIEIKEQLLVSTLMPLDSDNDGLIDLDDACPYEAGSINLQGCPNLQHPIPDDQESIQEAPIIALEEKSPEPEETLESTVIIEDVSEKEETYVKAEEASYFQLEDLTPAPDQNPAPATAEHIEPAKPTYNTDQAVAHQPAPQKERILKPRIKEEEKPVGFVTMAPVPKSPAKTSSPCESQSNSQLKPIFFAEASEKLNREALGNLDQLAEIMKSCSHSKLVLEGHADASGSDNKNMILSVMRAYNVKYYLVYEHGISQSRISSKGMGADDPIADNATTNGRERNRRVDFQILY